MKFTCYNYCQKNVYTHQISFLAYETEITRIDTHQFDIGLIGQVSQIICNQVYSCLYTYRVPDTMYHNTEQMLQLGQR